MLISVMIRACLPKANNISQFVKGILFIMSNCSSRLLFILFYKTMVHIGIIFPLSCKFASLVGCNFMNNQNILQSNHTM